jgi:hypothetical protein
MGKVYYGNMINLSGLYSKKPIKCYVQSKYFDMLTDKSIVYWDKDGNFNIDSGNLGIESKDGYIKFTSENEDEVKIWTNGVLASMSMIKRWCS